MNNADMPVHPTQSLDRQGLPEYPMAWGLTKREYFAAMAMQGLLASDTNFNFGTSDAARLALDQADALLKELGK